MADPIAIVLFNHKGGVSKTTTTFNLGWKFAEKGFRTVLVDADPQCNLTGMVLGFHKAEDLEEFYALESEQSSTIRTGLEPAFEAQPREMSPVPLVEIQNRDDLFLLPGDLRLSEYENTLGIAQELGTAIATLKNLPGSLRHLIDISAAEVEADIVLIDVSPGVGPLNQNLVATSDYAILPSAPDFFSVMAIDSISRVLPRWAKWANSAYDLEILRDASYPFPEPHLKVLGTIVQKYRPRGGSPARSFQTWIDAIDQAVTTKLTPALQSSNLLLPRERYAEVGISDDLCLAQIAEFNSLIAKSQEFRTPVFALSEEQLAGAGAVQTNWIEARDRFNEEFSNLADRVAKLTGLDGGSVAH